MRRASPAVQSLLQLLSIDVHKHRREFVQYIFLARGHLQKVKKAVPPLSPLPSSPAALAFDPYVGRQLQMVTPIRVMTPRSFEDTCASVESLLDGLQEVSLLSTAEHLTTWVVCRILYCPSFLRIF
jgi:hypothetical protein